MILSDALIERVLNKALSGGADFAEIYIEDALRADYTLKDSKPSKAISGHLCGAGIRVFFGHEQIYSYTNDLSEKSLLQTAETVAKALAAKTTPVTALMKGIQNFGNGKVFPKHIEEKSFALMKRADHAARSHDSKIMQVIANVSQIEKRVQVANSKGTHAFENRHYANSSVQVIVASQGQQEVGFERAGGLSSYEFHEKLNWEDLALTASKTALKMVNAEFAPAGEMPVVIDNGFGGVIFHEACGHGLETTSVAKNASVFCGKMGQKIAHECVTAIDDGTMGDYYGSLKMDDEGNTTKKTVLIKDGVLNSYIVDHLGSLKTGFEITGSGRRQDYRFAPTSRMRNTYIDKGNSTLEEMIKDIDYGIYAKKMGGGSVTPGTGEFNFATQEAYLVRNGKIEKPIKGASLIGTGIETLSRITKVGNELKLAPGTCGSVSGLIPTTVGQPAVLVSKLVVGGRS